MRGQYTRDETEHRVVSTRMPGRRYT